MPVNFGPSFVCCPPPLNCDSSDISFTSELVAQKSANSCTYQFRDTTTPQSDIVARLWDFGDGIVSTEQDPIHSFNVEDPPLEQTSFVVKLTITTTSSLKYERVETVSCI